jgi:glyoxylase-like metal-dependent hydrolase (beta-lactamase superfamily II)
MTEVHRIESTVGETPVNAYLIEGEDQLVAVDGTLTVSGGRSIAERIEAVGKPLAAVVVTHAHPDHYGGVVEFAGGPDASILATKGVDSVIRRDDEIKEEILRPMFDQEWPAERAFPTRIVDGGSELSFGDIELTVQDLGPGESPHDSIWFLGEGRGEVFSGDQGYNHMHGYLADGYWEEWLANIERLRGELSTDAVLHVGHGDPASTEVLDWERSYIERFLEAVRGADWEDTETAKTAVSDAMGAFLENQDLRFLMELSIEPVAAKLGLIAGRAGESGRQ